MSKTETIFVSLLDEGVDVWRPVHAVHVRDNLYRILDQAYDRDLETWQFVPGDEVICDMIASSDGRILAAVRKS